MSPPSPAPGTAREWLSRAQGKLALAREPLPPGAFWEDLCFLCQQGAELAIKWIDQVHGWLLPFVHGLQVLLDGLEREGLSIPAEVRDSDLTQPVRRAGPLSRPHVTNSSSGFRERAPDRGGRRGLGAILPDVKRSVASPIVARMRSAIPARSISVL